MKEMIKITADINEIKNRQAIEKLVRPNLAFFRSTK